jgi:dihydrolipoamide dehydrogenase
MKMRDLIVVGGGAGGYSAAVRAAQLGGKVTLVEKDKLGGICMNWGCIPMQFLLRNAMLIQILKEVKEDGINVSGVDVDYSKLITAKNKIVESTDHHILDNLEANNVEIVRGHGRLVSPNRVEIELDDGSREVFSAQKVILAPGSVPKKLSIPGAEGEGVITVKEALDIPSAPKSAVIIGGGVIGLELATFWASLGCTISVVELMPRVLPDEDHEIALFIEQAFSQRGVQIYTEAEVKRIEDGNGVKAVTISKKGEKHKIEAEIVVFAMGQSPYFDGLGLEDIGIKTSEGRIKTNNRMENNNIKGIYCVGDATGEIMLANVATVQGSVAAENAMGRDSTMDYRVVPRGVRTIPEIGVVGITEQEAKEKELKVKIGKYPFAQNPKALMLREGSGFIKVIADASSGEILGVHIVGPQATELIHEAAIAMQMRGTVQDIEATIHSHPCLHEAMQRVAKRFFFS